MDGQNNGGNWERIRARLSALESVNGTHLQAELKFRMFLQLRTVVEEGDILKFIEDLEKYSAEESVSLSDIINIQGPSGNSLLHIAAGIEKADILQALLEVIHDERFTAKANYQGDTALHVAARACMIRSAELLLGYGRIVDMVNDAGNTALHEAVKNGDSKLTSLLLSQGSKAEYPENKESKCPLYLAVETGNLEILKLLMEAMEENEVPWSRMQGMSPVHGALMHRRLDMLEEISNKKKKLFNLRDAGNGTPLHLAAYMNYVDGVKFLLDKFASSVIECNAEGYLPIHVACRMGHLETIKELLPHWPYPEEMLTSDKGQNILHVAAMYGMTSVVKYILGEPKHEKLINAKDKEGNTPLHVATLQWQPEVLFCLTRHNRVHLKLVNNDNLTALEIVDEQLTEIDAPLRKSLTRIILVSAKVPRSKDRTICRPNGLSKGRDLQPPQLDRLKDTAETRMVVVTLVAAMTFAAGFSVPGGYNGSEPNMGIATLLNKPMYNVFVICNTVAMYSSIIALVILLWTQVNDSHAVHRALRKARLPLLIALATMSMAFMAGVYVTISKHTWIAVVTLIVGITGLFVILILYIALFVPLWYKSRHLQLFADYIIRAAISISTRVTGGRATRGACFNKPDNSPGDITFGRNSEICEIVPSSALEIIGAEICDPVPCSQDSEISPTQIIIDENH